MIEFAPECPLGLRRFFHRNFGTFSQWFDHRGTIVRRIGRLEELLPSIEVETVRVSDLASGCEALHSFAGSLFPPQPRPALRFVAPTRLSAVGLAGGFPRDPYGHTYRVFVGDSLHDFAAYWNELRMCGCWPLPHSHALWVPAVLARESAFLEALRALLYEYSGQHSSGSRSVEVTSETLSSEDLKSICCSLGTGRARVGASAVDGLLRRARLRECLRDALKAPCPRALLDSTNAARLRVSERGETLSLSEPDVLIADGAWAVDVQVELGASTRFQCPRWWCLPRRTGSALAHQIFRAPARVSRIQLFAVEVERRSAHFGAQKTPELHVNLPEDSDVVESLLLGKHVGFGKDDAREKQLHEASRLSPIRVSDKGQNLRGLIEMFGSFSTAEEFCERKFWREALARLAGQDARRCKTLSEQIGNVVRGELRGDGKQAEMSPKAERITARILPWVHGALEDEPLSYTDLKALLDKTSAAQPAKQDLQYLSGDVSIHKQGVTPVSEEEMREGLNRLLARNVLRAGVVVRCQHCGLESWFHIDEVKQFNQCAGCGNPRPLTTGAEWRYRLNSLVKRCVSARILAVLQALACIAHRSTACFFYSPNLELFRPDAPQVWRELDVACVSDGELIIGEVKDGALDKHELDRFADAAEVIQPDRAAIFIPQDRFDKKAQQWFSELRPRLTAAGVRAEVHQLPAF